MGSQQSAPEPSASSSPCCPPTGLPARSAALAGATTPVRGEELVLLPGDMRAYVARPPQGVPLKGCLLLFHDIFGFASGRTHHLCDEMADWGYLVLAPDFYGRELDGVMEHEDIFSIWAPWRLFTGGGSIFVNRARIPWTVVEAKMNVALRWLEENGGMGQKIGTMGFCWGGWAITRAAASGKFTCAIGAHPAPLVQMFQKTGPTKWEMYSHIKCPILYMPSYDDRPEIREDGADFREIKRHQPESKSVLFKDMIHGWVNRGDIRDPKIKAEVDRAMQETREFLDRFVATNAKY